MHKILLVDDEKQIILLFEKYLSRNGFEVLKTSVSLEVFHLLEANPDISLIVLDMKMPGMSGIEIIKRLRQAGSSIPVLMLTGSVNLELHSGELKSCGFPAEDILPKPIRLADLLLKIKSKLHIDA